jgi:glycosyltransferase involved in cell wall biosynthesis
VALLRNYGNVAIEYRRHNNEIRNYGTLKKALLYFRTSWAEDSYRHIRDLCRKEKPDIVHFHNTLPLISPSAYYACKEEGIPVVQTLHNYRLICADGLLMRNGKICEECAGGNFRPALKHRCYRNSYIQTRAIVRMLKRHRKRQTYEGMVHTYIAQTEFLRQKFIQAGFPAERIIVKPNFLADPPQANYGGDYALFLGRLSPEKGAHILIEAWKDLDFPLKIAGDGPQREELEEVRAPDVSFLGQVSQSEVFTLLSGARFLVFPSLCYESFPRVLVESFACGKPVVASRLGAAAEIMEDRKTGFLFEPGNPDDLAAKAKLLIADPALSQELGRNARAQFEEKYTAEKNYEQLLRIYDSVIEQPVLPKIL